MAKYFKQTRHWVATLNNSGFDAVNKTRDSLLNLGAIHYIIGEEGYTQGRTPHLQMAFCFQKALPFKELKAAFPRAHLEQLNYAYEDAVRYCKKENRWHEHGDMALAYAYDVVDKEFGKALQRNNEKALALKESMKGDKGDVISITSPLSPGCIAELYSSDPVLFRYYLSYVLHDEEIFLKAKEFFNLEQNQNIETLFNIYDDY